MCVYVCVCVCVCRVLGQHLSDLKLREDRLVQPSGQSARTAAAMGGAIAPAQRPERARSSHALRAHLLTQRDEASEAVADTLFNSGPARQLWLFSAIFTVLRCSFPICEVKGGGAFLLHMQAFAATLPHPSRQELEGLLRDMPMCLRRMRDLDFHCQPLARGDARRCMVHTLSVLACYLGDLLTELWPEIEARVCKRTSLCRGTVEYLVTSYHDGALHPAVDVVTPPEVPVAGGVHAHLREFHGSVVCLGRIKLCFWNPKHRIRIHVPFLDVTVPVVDEISKALVEVQGPVAILADGREKVEGPVTVVADGCPVVVRSMPALSTDLLRMIFHGSCRKPWENPRYESKLRKHLMKAFVLAFAMDGIRLHEDFSELVIAATEFMKKERRRGNAIVRRLSYLGIGKSSKIDLQVLKQRMQRLSHSNVKKLLRNVLSPYSCAPGCSERGFDWYIQYITDVCDILDRLDSAPLRPSWTS